MPFNFQFSIFNFQFSIVLFLLSLAASFPAAAASLPVQPSTWRPYKDLPDVLYYEGFEKEQNVFTKGAAVEKGSTDKDKLEKGTAVEQDPSLPSAHAYKLGEPPDWGKGDHDSYTWLELKNSQLQIPMGLLPGSITVQFSVWSDEEGYVNFKGFCTKGDYEKWTPVPKAKVWTPLSFKLTELFNKGSKLRPDKEHVITALELYLKPNKPKDKNAVPRTPIVFIDDFVITVTVRPADILGRLVAAEMRRTGFEKTLAKDGFIYSASIQDSSRALQRNGRGRKKSKTVLVFAASPDETQTMAKELSAAAQSMKENGYTFVPAVLPGGKAIGGVDDMRLLLPYNLQESTPEAVLMCFGSADAANPGPNAESVRIIVERATNAGVIPILCMPASSMGYSPSPPAAGAAGQPQNKNVNFAKALDQLCAAQGLSWIDSSFAGKAAENVPGVSSATTLAMRAIKMIHDGLSN